MKQECEIQTSNSKISISQAIVVRKQVFALEQGIISEIANDELDNEANHALAYCNKEVIGTARLVLRENRGGFLGRVTVVKSHRNQGIGTKLIKSLENTAKEVGVETITIFPHEHLKSYYEALGYIFLEIGDVVFEHQLLKMSKELEKAINPGHFNR